MKKKFKVGNKYINIQVGILFIVTDYKEPWCSYKVLLGTKSKGYTDDFNVFTFFALASYPLRQVLDTAELKYEFIKTLFSSYNFPSS
jgi:hypothetical protein